MTQANRTGNTLENTVVGVLSSKGLQLVYYREYQKHPELHGGELLLRNVPYMTIYGHPGNTEFLIRSSRYNLEVRIECKWQQVPGSVDEKFPYLYLNCIEAMPERDIIIILGGGGAKAGAITWLRNTSILSKYTTETKNIHVFTIDQFIRWANNTLR